MYWSLWDNKNKRLMTVMSIVFGIDGEISCVQAREPSDDPIVDGYYNYYGEDLDNIGIVGGVEHNVHLFPEDHFKMMGSF
jgi:hypothetical protein